MRSVAIAFALAALAACEHRPPGAAAPAPLVDDEGMLQLDGLGKFGPQIREAMGTRAERAARAPYSPPGWPLRRGEKIESWEELEAAFPRTCGIRAPFWVGDRVFGAALGDGYVGHYREYVHPALLEQAPWSRCQLPPHLGGEVPAALARIPYDEVVRIDDNASAHPPYWTRERWLAGYVGEDDRRSQREALGLPLPEPWPDKETWFKWWRECLEDNVRAKGVVHWTCSKPELLGIRNGVEIWG